MTFGNAIGTCLGKYADFSGRASRSEFWFFILFAEIVYFLCIVILVNMASVPQEQTFTLIFLLRLPLWLPELAVMARRLHDMDQSGWLVLIILIPVLGILILLIMAMQPGTAGPNRFGQPEDATGDAAPPPPIPGPSVPHTPNKPYAPPMPNSVYAAPQARPQEPPAPRSDARPTTDKVPSMNEAPMTVDVLLTGNTLENADIDQAAAAMAGLTRFSLEQVRDLITSGELTLLRRGLSPEKGLALTARFAAMGIDAVMRPGAPATPPAGEMPQQQPEESQPANTYPPAPTATLEQPTYTNSIGMEFVLIPAGTFLMGSPAELGRSDEHPQHQVSITRPFWLGKYPVTQAQWQVITGSNPSKFQGCPTHPVERVSWNDVQQFIAGLNAREGHNRYRLPTEAEWEYACRAGTTTKYFFGDDAALLDGYVWHYRNSNGTQPVGQKEPNSWGLYDMLGNVGEWMWDWYNETTYAASPPQDPCGPERGKERALRGSWYEGSWHDNTLFYRSASRYHAKPDKRAAHIGFRLAMTAE